MNTIFVLSKNAYIFGGGNGGKIVKAHVTNSLAKNNKKFLPNKAAAGKRSL